jgi:MFS family permease
VLGNAIEFYDFTTYATFATLIGRAFFPSHDPVVSLLLSVAAFGAGFLTRPLGGIVIGAFADRVGRRPAMTVTIVMMALGTGLIALVPGYDRIGVAAPVLVVLARLVQGFAVGGEVGPATAYLLEAAPAGARARYGAWQSASQGIASVVAGLLGFGLSAVLTEAQLAAWGWRIPFALGVLALPVGLYIRQRLEETLDRRTVHGSAGQLLGQTVTRHGGSIGLAILAIIGGTVATYVNLYMTTYAQATLGMAVGSSMLATIVVGLGGIAFAALGGITADRWGRRKVMIIPRILLALFAWPAFAFLARTRTVEALLLITGTFSLLNSFSVGTVIVQVSDCFPQAVRSTATAAAYALSVAVFGGSTQFMLTKLIEWTGDPVAPAYYLIAMSIPSAIAAWYMRSAEEPA